MQLLRRERENLCERKKNLKKISTFKNGHAKMQFCLHKAPKLSLGNYICLLLLLFSRPECFSCFSCRESVKCFTLQEWRRRIGFKSHFLQPALGIWGGRCWAEDTCEFTRKRRLGLPHPIKSKEIIAGVHSFSGKLIFWSTSISCY